MVGVVNRRGLLLLEQNMLYRNGKIHFFNSMKITPPATFIMNN